MIGIFYMYKNCYCEIMTEAPRPAPW